MRRLRHLCSGLGFAVLAVGPAIAGADAVPSTIASVKPVHSLLAGVMEGVSRPDLLVRGGASPHTWSLRPSDARHLDDADLVVWVGEELETFLERPLRALADDAHVLELSRAQGVTLLRLREGGEWDEHEHGHENEVEGAESEDDSHTSGYGGELKHGVFNMHLWLDPRNAGAMVDAMADALSEVDPGRTAIYRQNAARLRARIHWLDLEIEEILAPVSNRGFIVFHDAWQYFDRRYGLRALGSVTVNPEQPPGAARLTEIRATLTESRAECVFAEPQFEPRLVRTLVAGTGAAIGTLDPLGAAIEEGLDLYFTLMRDNADSFRACFDH